MYENYKETVKYDLWRGFWKAIDKNHPWGDSDIELTGQKI